MLGREAGKGALDPCKGKNIACCGPWKFCAPNKGTGKKGIWGIMDGAFEEKFWGGEAKGKPKNGIPLDGNWGMPGGSCAGKGIPFIGIESWKPDGGGNPWKPPKEGGSIGRGEVEVGVVAECVGDDGITTGTGEGLPWLELVSELYSRVRRDRLWGCLCWFREFSCAYELRSRLVVSEEGKKRKYRKRMQREWTLR